MQGRVGAVSFASFAIVIVLLIAVIGPGSALANAPDAAPNCASMGDSYEATSAMLAACGVESFPLLGRHRLTDRGTSFEYNVDGDRVWINVPPVGFDPDAASAEELAQYGLSSAAGARQVGNARLTSATTFVTPPDHLNRISGVRFAKSLNWAGYVATNTNFTYAANTFTEPIPRTPNCTGGALAIWAGLGGYNGDSNLAQNGTAQGSTGLGQDQAWYEILTAGPMALNFYATRGPQFSVSTTHVNANTFQFFFYNAHTEEAMTVNVQNGNYSGGSAEAILERPYLGNGVFTPLENYGSTTLSGWANYNPIGSFAHVVENMWSVGFTHVLSSTGALGGDNKTFSETWNNCS